MKEEWIDILGFEGVYQVSSFGRVKSLDRIIFRSDGARQPLKGKIIRSFIGTNGYLGVKLSSNSIVKTYEVHRLVALSFYKNSNKKLHVNHKDGNKLNNFKSNLELVTRGENEKHAYATGLKKPPKGMLGKFGKEHHLSKMVLQLDLNKNEIGRYYSAREAERETGIKACNIGAVCRGNTKHKSAGGFLWKFENN